MQNMDYYSRSGVRNHPYHLDTTDPEYFARMNEMNHRENERIRKKATGLMSFVIALCIISFTAGLVIGIKFAGGPQKEIVDESTRQAMSSTIKKVSGLLNENAAAEVRDRDKTGKNASDVFPRSEYPFVIPIGKDLSREKSQEIAGFLSSNGHTVILSRSGDGFRLFTGPFKTMSDAENSLKKIAGYSNKAWFQNAQIVKR
jgi:hypothetical protein